MGLKKLQKQGKDENTRRLSCCRKVVVKKDWKTTLHLLHSQETEEVFLYFFQAYPYLYLIFTENFLPLVV